MEKILLNNGEPTKLIIRARDLMYKGKYKESLKILDDYDFASSKNYQEKVEIDVLKSSIFNNLGEFSKALEIIESTINESRSHKFYTEWLDASCEKVTALSSLGKIDESFIFISQIENELRSLKKESITDVDKRLALLSNHKGSLYWAKGELIQALKYLEEGLSHAIAAGDTFNKAASLHNIGAIHWRRGDLDKAIEYHEEALVYFIDQNKKQGIATSFGNMGEIFRQKGDLNKALEYYHKSLKYFEELGYNWYISKILFYLILVSIDMSSIEEAKKHLQYIEMIMGLEDNLAINQRFRISKALILKTSKRTRDRGKSEEILEKVIQEEMGDNEVMVIALLNLCELLLTELRITGDPELLIEVQSLVNKLFNIASSQYNYLLLTDTYILKSKLALIQLDTKKARIFLDQAQEICENKGLKKLAMSISNEYDTLLSQLAKWEEFIDRNASMSERIEFTEFENIIDQMLKKKRKEFPTESTDNPVSLLILEDRGTTIFSKHFGLDNQTMADDQIIGGFLTAINSFMQNAFSTTGYLERIKHKDYTLILKTKSPFTFCYVFKGQSYSAMKKLDRFITKVKESDSIWASFLRYVNSTILPSEPERISLEKIAEKIFA